ncbi:MAG: radical SAM protein [Candidatus Aenigmarchaeota archaeon]|nr:radical SAM protein [Candidatus Aenigmarchaeota archaeon]
MEKYPRFLVPNFKSFDPLKLARETEKIVTREGKEGLERKYTGFQSRPVYGGMATGYAVGCCSRCVYCWSDWSRDFPDKLGKFYSPREVAKNLLRAAEEGIPEPNWRERFPKINKLRLSGCEPTIGKKHLLSVLEYIKGSGYLFYLETNGILFGADRDYVKKLSKFSKFIYVRVSFKAATPKGFTQRTGAIGKYYELPFRALKYLLEEGIYARAAAMTDPRVMPAEERKILIDRLDKIDPKANYASTLEEEKIDAYDTTIMRMKAFTDAGFAKKLEEELQQSFLNF